MAALDDAHVHGMHMHMPHAHATCHVPHIIGELLPEGVGTMAMGTSTTEDGTQQRTLSEPVGLEEGVVLEDDIVFSAGLLAKASQIMDEDEEELMDEDEEEFMGEAKSSRDESSQGKLQLMEEDDEFN